MAQPPKIRPRGIRTPIPPGYVLGRTSPGVGDPELIAIKTLGQQLVISGGVAPGGTTHSYLGFVIEGPVPVGKQYIGAISHVDLTMPSTTIGSIAQALVAPQYNFRFYLVNDLALFLASGAPSGALAHVDFTAGNTAGNVTWYAAPQVIPALTVLYTVFPSNDLDPNLAKIILLFAGDL